MATGEIGHGELRDAVYISTATGMALFFHRTRAVNGVSIDCPQFQISGAGLRGSPHRFWRPRGILRYLSPPVSPFTLPAINPCGSHSLKRRIRVLGSNYLAARRPPPADGHGQVVYSFSEFLPNSGTRQDLVLRVFVKEKNLQRLTRDVGATPRILTKYGEYLLVTNR